VYGRRDWRKEKSRGRKGRQGMAVRNWGWSEGRMVVAIPLVLLVKDGEVLGETKRRGRERQRQSKIIPKRTSVS
jgi:hypothetical protein